MSEALKRLEQRIAHLEDEVRKLKAGTPENGSPWWEQIVGIHKDDPVYAEIVKEMKRNRRAEYRAAAAEADKHAKGKKSPRVRAGKPTRT